MFNPEKSKKTNHSGFVLSKPTMCLRCHLVVEMFHEKGIDPIKGAWQCPQCGHQYKFVHWKIKRAKQKEETKKNVGIPTWGDVWENRRNASQ